MQREVNLINEHNMQDLAQLPANERLLVVNVFLKKN